MVNSKTLRPCEALAKNSVCCKYTLSDALRSCAPSCLPLLSVQVVQPCQSGAARRDARQQGCPAYLRSVLESSNHWSSADVTNEPRVCRIPVLDQIRQGWQHAPHGRRMCWHNNAQRLAIIWVRTSELCRK